VPEARYPEQSRLPALLNGAHAVDHVPSRWWGRAANAAGVSAAGLFTAGFVDTNDPWSVGGIAMVLVMSGLRRRGRPRRVHYPYLGRAQRAWRIAGATNHQLAILDEAHRLQARTPPVGYRDRRTVVNPLADAYAIFTSPAWRDPWLADHKLVIDPVVEAAEVLDHLHRVTALLADVRRQLSVLPPGSGTARTYRGYEQALLGSLDDGLRRARALTAYRQEVHRLEELLQISRIQAEAQAFGDRVMDVVSESARQELATHQLDDSRAQLRDLEHGLREITDLLGSTPELPVEPRR
jgi:hypothetical protein